ncbi:hypothetical protein EMCRGX_G013820 [Ephydatia muelleri]
MASNPTPPKKTRWQRFKDWWKSRHIPHACHNIAQATADTVPSSGPGTFREAVTSTEAADSDISKQTPANFRLPTFAVSTKVCNLQNDG